MKSRSASSQVALALLTEGVSRSRIESHRIQLMIGRVIGMVESSEQKDHLYQVAGDIISGLPKRIDALNMYLDRTNLALSKMGETFYESRLPLSEKVMVDEAIEAAFGMNRHSMAHRVAEMYVSGNKFAASGTFEEAVSNKKFKNPDTGNDVTFGALPADEQKKIRDEWQDKNESSGLNDSKGKSVAIGDWVYDSKMKKRVKVLKIDTEDNTVSVRVEDDGSRNYDKRPISFPFKQTGYWTKAK